MGATVAGDIPLNEPVELQFQLPNSSHSVRLRAEVRYRQGFQYGFKFQTVTAEQLKTIRDGMEGLSPEESMGNSSKI